MSLCCDQLASEIHSILFISQSVKNKKNVTKKAPDSTIKIKYLLEVLELGDPCCYTLDPHSLSIHPPIHPSARIIAEKYTLPLYCCILSRIQFNKNVTFPPKYLHIGRCVF